MKNLPRQMIRFFSVLAMAGALAGCSSVNLGSVGNDEYLAGKKTFVIAAFMGGHMGMMTGNGGVANAAATAEIRKVFEQHGYVYQDSGPADMTVLPAWQYSISQNPYYIQTQLGSPPVTPDTIQYVILSVLVRDGKGDKILWRGDTTLPITASSLTPSSTISLVTQALRNLPAMKPATAAAPAPTATATASPPQG
jgi:hypothetical protein